MLRPALAVLACLAAVYALAAADLVLRARAAFGEGERYLKWDKAPALRRDYLEARLAAREVQLRKAFEAGRVGSVELEQGLALARFERDQALLESPLKYACAWFESARDLFSPPGSPWATLARGRLARAKGLWKKELDSKGIPYQDHMLE